MQQSHASKGVQPPAHQNKKNVADFEEAIDTNAADNAIRIFHIFPKTFCINGGENTTNCRSSDFQEAINAASLAVTKREAAAHDTMYPFSTERIALLAKQNGIVAIHSGNYVISTPIEILSNVTIQLESNVLIQAAVKDTSNWPIDEPFPVSGV